MKPMPQIIKENITLVIALALPILLALFFMAARYVSETTTEPPQHDFLISTNQYNRSGLAVSFKVVDGQLVSTFTYPVKNKNDSYDYKDVPDIYLVDAQTMIAEPVPLPLPANWKNPPAALEGNAVDMFLPGISDKEWTATTIAPDGYEFGQLERYDYNLMTEIFSGHRDRGYGIHKGGRVDKIRGLPQNVYHIYLIAWEEN
jgi:hypothetical protein